MAERVGVRVVVELLLLLVVLVRLVVVLDLVHVVGMMRILRTKCDIVDQL